MGQAASSRTYRKRTPQETLQVPEDASLSDIKKAYRKLALEYHPDALAARGISSSGEFEEISNAYELLCQQAKKVNKTSSPGASRKQEPNIDLLDCIEQAKSLSKIGEGDFSRINNLFDEISKIEKITRGKIYYPPAFGYAKGNPKIFYDFYQTFSTLRHFNITPYDITSNYDYLPRYGKREIDAETKRLIEAKRLDYNLKVRELVKMLYRKDPRVNTAPQKKILDVKSIKPTVTKKGVEIKEKNVLTAEEKARINEEYLTEQQSVKSSSTKSSYDKAKEQETDKDIYICEPCKKAFKSVNQLDNHANSKKHKEKVENMSKEEIEDLLKLLKDQHLIDKEEILLSQEKPLEPIKPTPQKQEEKVLIPKSEELPKEETKTSKNKKPEEKAPPKNPIPSKMQKTGEVDLRSGAAFALSCAKCKEIFPSRNQLFEHLKDTGHSAPLKKSPQIKK
ncbi:DnaJ-like protein subfamily A member 5 [Nematocida sp. LUAm3]|nr:DnaJ-like protein subfamily A member 5 [Nematocida sp. LUAm3]KAI5175186.1 DnaJ-like protein subfamily A member 5 [Nematocida sp. LUAm2]KAI5178142.1 DnaJ-like protein subfamily A member 5 [Nematocida sp. LUAm1]